VPRSRVRRPARDLSPRLRARHAAARVTRAWEAPRRLPHASAAPALD
jgi:hypothetical protein